MWGFLRNFQSLPKVLACMKDDSNSCQLGGTQRSLSLYCGPDSMLTTPHGPSFPISTIANGGNVLPILFVERPCSLLRAHSGSRTDPKQSDSRGPLLGANKMGPIKVLSKQGLIIARVK